MIGGMTALFIAISLLIIPNFWSIVPKKIKTKHPLYNTDFLSVEQQSSGSITNQFFTHLYVSADEALFDHAYPWRKPSRHRKRNLASVNISDKGSVDPAARDFALGQSNFFQ